MTRCPACGRRDDAGALFCPADGTALVADAGGPPLDDAAPSAALPRAAGSASGELDRLLSLPDPEASPVSLPPVQPAPPTAAPPRRLGAVVGVLVALVAGLVVLLLWQQRTAAAEAQARADTAEAEAVSVRRDADAQAETARLDRERIDAEDTANRADAERQQAAAEAFGAGYTATVWANSPGDGFLALRSGPTTASGTRLLKIPHGDALALGGCLAPTTSPGGRYGAWCRARYAGTDGWVFDAFLSR